MVATFPTSTSSTLSSSVCRRAKPSGWILNNALLLEASWEAFEDAGLDPLRLRGGKVGVYVGQWLSDFEQRLFLHPEEVDFQMTLGSGRYALSGRISYLFGFTGPSMTIDTACSSSLVAVHLASQSLRAGESDVAIAGGVNLILGPHIHIAYSQGGMMAPDGQCKFGDSRADGYVRSEGAGIVVLKRLEDALRDGDRVHAVIRGSAVNNDGASSGSMGTAKCRRAADGNRQRRWRTPRSTLSKSLMWRPTARAPPPATASRSALWARCLARGARSPGAAANWVS